MAFYANFKDGVAESFKLLSAFGDTLFRDNVARSIPSFKDVTLSATQMDTLNATPVELVAAPGAGKALIVDHVVAYVAPVSAAFELGSGVLDVKYTGTSGTVAAEFTNAFVESASAAVAKAYGRDVIAVANAALVAHCSADVTSGDGKVYLRVYYRTVLLSGLA